MVPENCEKAELLNSYFASVFFHKGKFAKPNSCTNKELGVGASQLRI